MRSRFYKGLGHHGFHRLHYLEWGDHDNPRTLVCVHGLTRNARDFDRFAQVLAEHYRVVCVDVAGRGLSDRLAVPQDYGYPLYLQDMATLLARLDVEQCDWVGTSMGGLIGMMLAAQPGTPIRRLVLNDVGPFIPEAALRRIGEYLEKLYTFETLEQAEAHLRTVHAPFGPLSDAQWQDMARHSTVVGEDGCIRMNYDPAIATPFKVEPIADVDLWPVWDGIRCPTLVLHGEQSDLLLEHTCTEMGQRGPTADIIQVPGVGHAPALLEAPQINAVRDWLLAA
jgi:pimeloyl-ACP methyl ester carboxylesterase